MADKTFNPMQRTRYNIDWRDLVRALIVQNDIREGVWRVVFKYDLNGMSVQWKGATGEHTRPAAILCATDAVLIRVEAEDAISVDAAKYWAEVEAERPKQVM